MFAGAAQLCKLAITSRACPQASLRSSPLHAQSTADGVMSVIGLCWSSAAIWHRGCLESAADSGQDRDAAAAAFQSLDQAVDAQVL